MTAPKRTYGAWAGFPKGNKEDASRCVVEVGGRERWPSYYQCHNKRGQGPDGLYCTLHANQIAKGRFPSVPREVKA